MADAAGLIRRIAETGARGRFNAAAPQPLTIRQWIDEIASEPGVPNVRKIALHVLRHGDARPDFSRSA